MHHGIDPSSAGPRAEAMTRAIETCVHCGFCLPTCPTYDALGLEADSPRGRIVLMKEVLEGDLSADQAAPHIDRCLGCLACEPNCPSGVAFGELLCAYRAATPQNQTKTAGERLRQKLASMTLPYPKRFRAAMRLGRLGRRLRAVTPKALRPLVDLVPESLPQPMDFADYYPAAGDQRGEVALHLGCAGRVLRPETSQAAIRVLNRNGFSVLVAAQGCCGALDWHTGAAARAERLATGLIDALPDSLDIVTTAAGCSSSMHEYPLMLADRDDATRGAAAHFAGRTHDIAAYLDAHGFDPPPRAAEPARIAYHDACHLAHAQRITAAPRNLLRSIEGVELLEVPEGHFCCGSAGTYNIDQPELAAELGRRKAAAIAALEPDVVALGNIGCHVQIERYLREVGCDAPVLHTIEILDAAYRQQPLLRVCPPPEQRPEPVTAFPGESESGPRQPLGSSSSGH